MSPWLSNPIALMTSSETRRCGSLQSAHSGGGLPWEPNWELKYPGDPGHAAIAEIFRPNGM